jgi:hypothetical protein
MVIDLRLCASSASMKTSRELEWKACEEKPRSISATENYGLFQYLYLISVTIGRTLNVFSLATAGDVHRHSERVVEGNGRWYVAECGTVGTHIWGVEIFYTEFSVIDETISGRGISIEDGITQTREILSR